MERARGPLARWSWRSHDEIFVPDILLFLPATLHAADQATFLETHCIRCHGAKTQKADRRFDTLPGSITTLAELESYQEIVDQLNLGAMPPEDEPQPMAAERSAMITSMTELISEATARLSDTGGHSVLRRINNWEYQQTIGDLLSINVSDWNPSEFFPAEVVVDGFDNNGKELVTSGMLLDHLLLAAEGAIERATHFDVKPQSQQYQQASPFYFNDKHTRIFRSCFRSIAFASSRTCLTRICTADTIEVVTLALNRWR